ncbi:uncharacterized protein TM35_000312370 [Trypanosoma theileri]|uniref:Uncharacterized protein n=1 Tax=Trypanosoma theileri TaxID=67003 RepID=A0A1X0NN67_9TRYP|nr:uncharacterized protein TM35_000312370 [Trypanosoma theileri]ORC86051.1 hypothetical protein TM35_000312370 [Trypanosoma theileri]
MSSKRTPARSISTAVSPVLHNRREEGDWKSTMKCFREEVQRLKEEGDSLRSTNTDLALLLRKVSEQMELLNDENHLSLRVMVTMLDDERQKVINAEKEKEELLQKIKEAEERCTLQKDEIIRLAGVVEEEQAKNSSILMLQEKLLAEKDAKFQLELSLQEKRLEEIQHDLRQQVERHEATLVANNKIVEEERLQWEKQQVAYEEKISRLLRQVKKRGRAHRQSPEPELEPEPEETDLHIEVDEPPFSPISFSEVADEALTRNASKKSRLEAARQQRRVFERRRENATLISLTKLNDLKENLHL